MSFSCWLTFFSEGWRWVDIVRDLRNTHLYEAVAPPRSRCVFTIANPIGNLPIVLSFTGGERHPDQLFPGRLGISVVVVLLAWWYM